MACLRSHRGTSTTVPLIVVFLALTCRVQRAGSVRGTAGRVVAAASGRATTSLHDADTPTATPVGEDGVRARRHAEPPAGSDARGHTIVTDKAGDDSGAGAANGVPSSKPTAHRSGQGDEGGDEGAGSSAKVVSDEPPTTPKHRVSDSSTEGVARKTRETHSRLKLAAEEEAMLMAAVEEARCVQTVDASTCADRAFG